MDIARLLIKYTRLKRGDTNERENPEQNFKSQLVVAINRRYFMCARGVGGSSVAAARELTKNQHYSRARLLTHNEQTAAQ